MGDIEYESEPWNMNVCHGDLMCAMVYECLQWSMMYTCISVTEYDCVP